MGNIHPAFVHFPIALLVLYTLLELVPLSRFVKGVEWQQIKLFFLYIGTLAIFPTILTGIVAADENEGNVLLPFHEATAFIILGIFSLASVVALYNHFRPFKNQKLVGVFQKVLAFLGILALLVIGALGAGMVYGYHTDPIVSFVTSLLGFH